MTGSVTLCMSHGSGTYLLEPWLDVACLLLHVQQLLHMGDEFEAPVSHVNWTPQLEQQASLAKQKMVHDPVSVIRK